MLKIKNLACWTPKIKA